MNQILSKLDRFGRPRIVIVGSIVLLTLITLLALFWFFSSAPPSRLVISAGPVGSSLYHYAERYQAILKQSGVDLIIIPSDGSIENYRNLTQKTNRVDIGFVQSGIVSNSNFESLVSLGAIGYEPIYIFYRSPVALNLISDFKGKRIEVGERGSGTRKFSHLLLSNNDILPGGPSTLLEIKPDEGAQDLISGKIDVAFMMGDSVTTDTMHNLLRDPSVRLYNFTQAEAYIKRFIYLHKVVYPMGGIDFGKNIPSHDVTLIGPVVEIIAKKRLHPALSDLILEAATKVHSNPGLIKSRNEFPTPLENDIAVSADAKRFYKSGQGIFYKILPFWVASLVDRIIVLILPLVVIFPSVIRGIPAFFQWRIRRRIYRWYRELLNIEEKVIKEPPAQLTEIYADLDRIENEANKNVPVSFAESFYILREHIDFVREKIRLNRSMV